MNFRPRRTPPSPAAYRRSPEVTIRWSTPDDRLRLETLAELDESPIPESPLLLGLVGDELWVAASLSTGTLIADPFRPSAEVASLVRQRGRQLSTDAGRTDALVTRFAPAAVSR